MLKKKNLPEKKWKVGKPARRPCFSLSWPLHPYGELVHLWMLILLERNTNRTCPGNREKMLFDMWIRPCWQTEHLPDTASKLRHLEKWAPHSSRALPPVSVSHLLACGDLSHILVKVQQKKRAPESLLKSLPSLCPSRQQFPGQLNQLSHSGQ